MQRNGAKKYYQRDYGRMGIDYVLLAGLLLYFAVIKMSARYTLKPIYAALIVVVGYFTLSSFVQGILLSAYDAPLWQLITVVPITTLIAQFCVAFITFMGISRSEESYASWIAWSFLGGIAIFFVTPFIVTKLFVGL